jgi:hypothetical protein
MTIKNRYKEIIFISDSCEALSIWDNIEYKGIYFISSSKKDQKASSTEYDWNFMMPLADRFTSLLYRSFEKLHKIKNFDFDLKTFINDLKKEETYLTSTISIVDNFGRDSMKIKEFIGDPYKDNSKNEKIIRNFKKENDFKNCFFNFLEKKTDDKINKNININTDTESDTYNVLDFNSKINNENKNESSNNSFSKLPKSFNYFDSKTLLNNSINDFLVSNKFLLENFHKIENELSNKDKFYKNKYELNTGIENKDTNHNFIYNYLNNFVEDYEKIIEDKYLTLGILTIFVIIILKK